MLEKYAHLFSPGLDQQQKGVITIKKFWRKGLSLVVVLLVYYFLTGLSHLPVPAYGSPSETIPVSIQAYAQWNHIVKDTDGEDLREESGFYRIMISGSMTLDRSGSPMVSQQGTMVMPVEKYLPDNLNATWVYEEVVKDLKSDTKCPMISTYKGSNSARITNGPGLLVSSFSSAAAPFMENLSEQEKQFAAQLQSQFQSQMKNAMPDHYQLALSGGTPSMAPQKVTVKGTRLKDPKDCIYEDVEKSFPGFSIGLQMQLPDSGTMTGHRYWKSNYEGGVPGFGISVSDITEFKGEKPFDPPEGGNGDVSYTLSWFIGVEPMPVQMAAEEDEEEDDCKKYWEKVNFICLKMAAFKNSSVREYCKNTDRFDDLQNPGDRDRQKMGMYKKAVQNAVFDAINNNSEFMDQLSDVADARGEEVAPPGGFSSEDPDWEEAMEMGKEPLCPSSEMNEIKEGQTDMVANSWGSGTPNMYGQDIAGTSIVDFCTGEPVTIQTTDGNGVIQTTNTGGSIECWKQKHGDQFGESAHSSTLNHEKTHVRQNVVKGPTKDVDDVGDRELEAMQKELEELLDKMKEHGCL